MNAIVAANSDWGIGLGGTQTIVIPEDRSRFKRLTDEGVVIVGRKTFESIPAGPLPNRKNIIITRDKAYKAQGAVIAHSVEEVLEEIAGVDPDKVFVVGGGEIYELFLPLCSYAHVTRIDKTPLSDTFFPNIDILPGWTLVRREFGIDLKMENSLPSNDENESIYCTFDLYKRQGRTVTNDHRG